MISDFLLDEHNDRYICEFVEMCVYEMWQCEMKIRRCHFPTPPFKGLKDKINP